MFGPLPSIVLIILVGFYYIHSVTALVTPPRDHPVANELVKRDLPSAHRFVKAHFNESDREFVTYALGLIAAIPDDIIQAGDNATDHWIVDHIMRGGPMKKRFGWAEIAKCGLALAKFLGNYVATSGPKIKQVKGWIDELGGIIKAANLILDSTLEEAAIIGNMALVNLIEFLAKFGGDVLPSCTG